MARVFTTRKGARPVARPPVRYVMSYSYNFCQRPDVDKVVARILAPVTTVLSSVFVLIEGSGEVVVSFTDEAPDGTTTTTEAKLEAGKVHSINTISIKTGHRFTFRVETDRLVWCCARGTDGSE